MSGHVEPRRSQTAEEKAARLAAVLVVLEASPGFVTPPDPGWELAQLAGGWSRHTYLLSNDRGPAYIVRVSPPGGILSTDLVREYRTYLTLGESDIVVPRVFGIEPAENTPFGGPFFVMEWKSGDAPNVWQRRTRVALEENWATSRSIAEDFVQTLARIHTADAERFAFLGPPQSFATVAARWRTRYEEMRVVDDPIVGEAFEWLKTRTPPDAPVALVHGDYRLGNVLVADGRITAVVDWELAYLGDPHFDLGYLSLDYFAGKFVHPGSILVSAIADRSWFIAEYERLTGSTVDPMVVRTYSVVGALMLITILTTGIRLFVEGDTTDVRMAWNRFVVPGLRQSLTELMDW